MHRNLIETNVLSNALNVDLSPLLVALYFVADWAQA
jgi:hypothetical protein